MIVYPAIDLRGGKVVRLRGGDPAQQTTYSDDPVATARRWQAAGAQWLHVVNLDGALEETGPNLDCLAAIGQMGLKIQIGGGLRTEQDVRRALENGAERVVLGTLAADDPEAVGHLVKVFGTESIAVALDSRDGMVRTRGWQRATHWSPIELGRRFAALGVRHALFTDISRDGGLQGVNAEATIGLAMDTGLAVIASGGVATLDDVRALTVETPIAGMVIGKALYTGVFTLEAALRIAAGREAAC